ncbi:chromatin accessibility complex 1 [Pitangus sulphuratus]|nr:chromatin accessibility complex 1 [Pitangus sulphuratus]
MAARLSENRLVSLPLSRIRVIMKSSPEVSSINQDALFLTAKATKILASKYLKMLEKEKRDGEVGEGEEEDKEEEDEDEAVGDSVGS